jgi:hypothetical protein
MLHKGCVITNFSKRYLSLERSEEEIFLIEFLFNLTVAYRTVFSSEGEDSAEIQFGLKQINELNHRLLNRLRDLRAGEKWSTQQSTVEIVEHHVKLSPIISGWVGRAASDAFNKINA